MADQDKPTTFSQGIQKGFTDAVSSAARGAGIVAGAARRIIPATPPGGDDDAYAKNYGTD